MNSTKSAKPKSNTRKRTKPKGSPKTPPHVADLRRQVDAAEAALEKLRKVAEAAEAEMWLAHYKLRVNDVVTYKGANYYVQQVDSLGWVHGRKICASTRAAVNVTCLYSDWEYV